MMSMIDMMCRDDIIVECSDTSGKDGSSCSDVFNGVKYSWCQYTSSEDDTVIYDTMAILYASTTNISRW